MMRAEGLARSFGGAPVIHDISFTIEPGEVVGFLGPNGAGKTTTIRVLLGLLQPSAGRVELTRPVGYLPEAFTAYDALSVAGYLRFCSRAKRIDHATAVPASMRAAGVTDLSGRPIGRLSKGQRQRVGLAQAVLGEPVSLVLDEPTIGLDPSQLVEARQLMRRCADGGAAVLFSTHLLAEAATVCDRIIVIVGGAVVAEERPGTVAELEERFLRLVGEAELSRGEPA